MVRARAVAAVLLAILAGCATTGQIPVELEAGDPVFVSPANQDGAQDAVIFDLLVVPLERTQISGFTVEVVDASGEEVYREARRLDSGDPPLVVLWDGRGDDGSFVADGPYELTVTVEDDNGNTGSSRSRQIVVDNTPPSVVVSAPSLLLTPDGDDRFDILAIYQRESSDEDEWVGEMIDEAGRTVRTFRWRGGARDFTWDGSADDGQIAAEGTYRYRVAATDRAGNTGRYGVDAITLERKPRTAIVTANRSAFSPNGDGRADTIRIDPFARISANLERWTIDVQNSLGEVVRRYTGTGSPTPVEFDGSDDAGGPVADGEYRAVLSLRYLGGQSPRASSDPFVVDTAPPQATVRLSTSVFSPDGDGAKDSVEIVQSSSEEREWVGTITDTAGTVVLERRWSGRVESFTWDGTDALGARLAPGARLPDGAYTYRLSAEDEALNTSRPIAMRIWKDVRATPTRVTAGGAGFSPNADGVQDSIDFLLGVAIDEGIARWTVSILTPSGAFLDTIAAGVELPESVSWTGSLAGEPASDGPYVAEFRVEYEKGNVTSGRSATFRLDTTPPVVAATVTPELFSPDDDGVDDLLEIAVSVTDSSPIVRWRMEVFGPDDELFMSREATGVPPTPIRWDGRADDGELVQSVADYRLQLRATDAVGNEATASAEIPVGILVIREGDRLRIRVSSIYFEPYTADYTDIAPELSRRNLETLDRLAETLGKYPQYSILVEGHAAQIHWDNPKRARLEQLDELLPLSLARAEAIRDALVARGIEPERLSVTGQGGLLPVVPHSDEENRWRNRRVEFLLRPGAGRPEQDDRNRPPGAPDTTRN